MSFACGTMRIGFFTSIEGWGGSELYLLAMAEAVSESGHDSVFIGPAGARIEQECRLRRIPFVAWRRVAEEKRVASYRRRMISVLPLSVRLLLGNLREALILRRIFRQIGPDIIHVNVHGYEMAGLACRFAGIPCVGVYATSPVQKKDRTRRWLIRRTVHAYDRLVTKSRASAQAWNVDVGIPAEEFTVIWNGVDTVRFSPADSAQKPADRGVLRLVSVGRLHQMKGYRHVIEAVASLRDCDVTLTIAGDGELRAELETLAGRLGVAKKVRFLGNVEDVVPLLRESDAFVLASVSHESFPSAVAQAMACGLPVVTSDFGPFKEINQEGITGFVVPSGDSDAFAGAVRKLAMDPVLREAMGQAGRERAVSCFGVGTMVRRTMALYEELGAKRRVATTDDTRRLRIGVFTSIEGRGGSESYLQTLMTGLQKKGYELVLFGVGGTPLVREARLDGIEVVEWKQTGLVPWRTEDSPQHGSAVRSTVAFVPAWVRLLAGVLRETRIVRKVLRAHPVDVLHVNVNGYEVASFAAWMKGIPSLAMCMTSPAGESNLLRMALIRWGLRLSTLVSAQSRACAEAWRHQAGLDARRVSFVWNGINTTRFAPEKDVRQRNANDAFRLISVGRLHPMKGHHVLIEAMRILNDARISLQILGEGDQGMTLRRQVEASGLQDKVQIMGQSTCPEECLCGAHAFVLASVSHESGPAAVTEAMAAGLPLITSDFGPLSEMNLDGITGVVVPVGDSAALAQAICRLADDPDGCMKMGQIGRQHAERFFTSERMVEQTERLYRTAMFKYPHVLSL